MTDLKKLTLDERYWKGVHMRARLRKEAPSTPPAVSDAEGDLYDRFVDEVEHESRFVRITESPSYTEGVGRNIDFEVAGKRITAYFDHSIRSYRVWGGTDLRANWLVPVTATRADIQVVLAAIKATVNTNPPLFPRAA